MKIVIVGYWNMWKMVEQIANEKESCSVVSIVSTHYGELHFVEDILWKEFDIVIDFSLPDKILKNIEFYAKNNIKAVIGGTGWYKHIDKVKDLYKSSNGAILWASNFSIWVNLFWEILKNASQIMNNMPDYDVFWHEFHHNKKIDSPSGTALTTANILLDNIDRKTDIVTQELKRKIQPNELHFSSTRWWSIPWTHSVYFDSLVDTIQITHTARWRHWFALWAVLAGQWLTDKQGYYEISDWMKTIC